MSRRALLVAVALPALWLGLGLANTWRGVDQPGARYKFWAFQHHCYSDVLALYGDRYEGGGRPVPYLEDRLEYPVLLGLALWLPAFAPGGARGHLLVTALLLAACLALALAALRRLPDARPWWLGATPALAYYAFLNWDLLPIALTALALLALTVGRAAGAGAAAALGMAAKLFPVALVPAALGALAGAGLRPGPGGGWRRARPLLAFSAALGAVVGRRLDLRASHSRLLPPARLLAFEAAYRRWGNWLLLGNRFLPGIRAFIFLAAGASGIPARRVMWLGGLSAVLWNGLLLAAGGLVAHNLEELLGLVDRYMKVAGVLMALGLAALLVRMVLRRRAPRAGGGDR